MTITQLRRTEGRRPYAAHALVEHRHYWPGEFSATHGFVLCALNGFVLGTLLTTITTMGGTP